MSKYKVGDELRIREWNDMEAEFGLDQCGNIQGFPGFAKSMRYLCGSEFTVSKIVGDSKYYSIEKIEYTRPGNPANHWNISSYMLEPRIEEPLYTASDTDINNFLFK